MYQKWYSQYNECLLQVCVRALPGTKRQLSMNNGTPTRPKGSRMAAFRWECGPLCEPMDEMVTVYIRRLRPIRFVRICTRMRQRSQMVCTGLMASSSPDRSKVARISWSWNPLPYSILNMRVSISRLTNFCGFPGKNDSSRPLS